MAWRQDGRKKIGFLLHPTPLHYPPPVRRFAEEGAGKTVRLSRCLPRPPNLPLPTI